MIHPTAIIAAGAEVAGDAEVGPFCVIGPHVKLGAGSRLLSHVVVDGHTTIGRNNIIHPFAGVGTLPQDLKFKGEPARLVIGDNNVIREGVTLNIGTEAGSMETRIGNGCLFMANSHVAHDCVIGDHVVMANCVGVAGHVDIGDHVIIGGLAAIHQFCRIGRNAFVAGGGMVAQDIPPFCIAQGDRAQLVGINVVGLKRTGWERQRIGGVRQAFKQIFQTGSTRLLSLERAEKDLAHDNADVREMTEFIRTATRGVCPPRVVAASELVDEP